MAPLAPPGRVRSCAWWQDVRACAPSLALVLPVCLTECVHAPGGRAFVRMAGGRLCARLISRAV
eukprot:2578243-Prymnesium_polylepis.1